MVAFVLLPLTVGNYRSAGFGRQTSLAMTLELNNSNSTLDVCDSSTYSAMKSSLCGASKNVYILKMTRNEIETLEMNGNLHMILSSPVICAFQM